MSLINHIILGFVRSTVSGKFLQLSVLFFVINLKDRAFEVVCNDSLIFLFSSSSIDQMDPEKIHLINDRWWYDIYTSSFL